jgi:hypothetical protein
VRALRIPVALGVILVLVALTAWIMAWPFEKAVYLAPVIVIGGAAALGLVILWGKVAVQSLRESKRPRLVLALWLAGLARIAPRGLTPRSRGGTRRPPVDNGSAAA